MKYLRIYNISIHINFYQNRLKNKSVRKNFLKFSERRKDVKTERRKDVKTWRRSFFVSCRRTYVLNNTFQMHICKLFWQLFGYWIDLFMTPLRCSTVPIFWMYSTGFFWSYMLQVIITLFTKIIILNPVIVKHRYNKYI